MRQFRKDGQILWKIVPLSICGVCENKGTQEYFKAMTPNRVGLNED